jgi:hypothetical protein
MMKGRPNSSKASAIAGARSGSEAAEAESEAAARRGWWSAGGEGGGVWCGVVVVLVLGSNKPRGDRILFWAWAENLSGASLSR